MFAIYFFMYSHTYLIEAILVAGLGSPRLYARILSPGPTEVMISSAYSRSQYLRHHCTAYYLVFKTKTIKFICSGVPQNMNISHNLNPVENVRFFEG